ncbi:hypothetical protein WT60_26515 [Burkholderia sp. MSMB617WGS]|uniref:hypothetical protein n=1 Tax=Burkholderia sp. MSMB617WGS TaxID=1637831 RepID=UPI00075FD98C|nr:hypothetical protein [Burkholderia sp. MSMB617WGS]AOK50370.1 hypothetical protein WT60_26515 [Burkholderia sp. MSMB617WGS]
MRARGSGARVGAAYGDGVACEGEGSSAFARRAALFRRLPMAAAIVNGNDAPSSRKMSRASRQAIRLIFTGGKSLADPKRIEAYAADA